MFKENFIKKLSEKIKTKNPKEAASILGSLAGDGSVIKRKEYELVSCLMYVNKNFKLIQNFKRNMLLIAKESPSVYHHNNAVILQWRPLWGKVFVNLGATAGNKNINGLNFPKWIWKNKDSQKEYIRSLFDDEGSVGYYCISLSLSILESKTDNLKTFLCNIEKCLKNFEIICGKIKITKRYKTQLGNFIEFRLSITNRTSIKSFYKNIGFLYNEKFNKLKKIFESYKYKERIPILVTRNNIIKLLCQGDMTRYELASALNKHVDLINRQLYLFERKNIILKKGRKYIYPGKSFITQPILWGFKNE